MNRPFRPLTFIIALTLSSLTGKTLAAPGTLPDTPLFLGTSAPPNIMFLIDDSGSMDWEIMSRDLNRGGTFTGSQPDGSNPNGFFEVKHRDSDEDGNAECFFNSGTFYGYIYGVEFGSNTYGDNSADCNTADDEAWRFRNSDYNPLYFDPSKTYLPWSGKKKNLDPFENIDIFEAPDNPYDPVNYIDLTTESSDWQGGTGANNHKSTNRDNSPDGMDGFRFYTWSDNNNNGDFDNGEETEYLIADITDAQAGQWGKTAAQMRQDFANWFGYYRSREFVAKAAYGKIIFDAEGVRMGLTTLHSKDYSGYDVSTKIADMSNASSKNALLEALYSMNSNGSTPLRTNMEQCGRYLECKSNKWFGSDCPALPEADGGNCQQNFSIVMTDGFYNGFFSMSPSNTDGDNNTSFDGGAYGDTYRNTLADIAMHYYERDIQPGISDDVPTIAGVDENDKQHVVTYTVAFGVDGSLTSNPVDPEQPFSWPRNNTNSGKVDDLRHAAYNGRGLFLSAQKPDELISALGDVVADISGRQGSGAGVTVNSGVLGDDSRFYQTLFDSNDWSGTVQAVNLDPDNAAATGTAWDAAVQLESKPFNNRVILTLGKSGDGSKFKWNKLTSAQKNDLKTNPDGSTSDVDTAKARIDYLWGDRTHEAAGTTYNFRKRTQVLGDIIHSAAVFVGQPNSGWPDTAPFPTGANSYSNFSSANKDRLEMVYAGANDGMLHGFRASNGNEKIAYIPSNLFSNSPAAGLHYLTDPLYQHKYYVDLTPTISDVYIDGDWTTVLVGGERGGGRAMFALDITDPSSFGKSDAKAAKTVMWEFTDNDLGFTYSEATVALFNDGNWYAVFGNGYNDTGSGEATLFMVDIKTGVAKKFSTGVGSSSDRNGLGTPVVADTNGDGTGDRVYAGDLKGNLWAFDLCQASDNGSCATSDSGWGLAFNTPLFTTASNQPITAKPNVAVNPDQATTKDNQPNLLVLFGSGRYLTAGDPGNTDMQTCYSVWDTGQGALTRSDLQPQTISNAGGGLRTVTDANVDYGGSGGSTKYGCYFDLIDAGERVLNQPVVFDDLAFFSTAIPSVSACSAEGSGWLMAVEYSNCGEPDKAPVDFNRDGFLDDKIGNDPPIGQFNDDGLPPQPTIILKVPPVPNKDGEKPKTYITTPCTTGGCVPGNPQEGKEVGTRRGRLSWEQLQ